MTIGIRCLARLVLPGLLAAAWGCDSGSGRSDDDDDGSSDGDGDGDSDVDTCAEDPCACYPEGPYKWFEGSVVSPVDFPAIHGTGGAETTLDMCVAHAQSAGVKSLVFAVGANTWPSCPARFEQLGNSETAINEAHGELVGVYFAELTNGSSQTLGAVSAKMDSFGWDGGWRINDNAQRTIWLASDGAGNWLFSATPSVWVLNTVTMEIVDSEWDQSSVNVLSVVQDIDANY